MDCFASLAMTMWRQPLRQNADFPRRINVIWVVQSRLQKYSASVVGQITRITPPVSRQMRGARDRHERAVRCDGRERRDRRTRLTHTAKSCGPDAAVLALSPREAKLLGGDGGKKAVHRGEHEVSRKAIAQGRPECSRCPVCSCAVLFAQIARETAGAASTRSSLRPLFERAGCSSANLGQFMSRDRERIFSRRHPPCAQLRTGAGDPVFQRQQ